MRVGLVLDESLDGTDGIQQYMLRLEQWLRDHGHEVHFLVGETTRNDVSNVHSLSKNVKVKFNGNRLSMPLPTSKKKLQAVLDELALDVLHVQTPYSPFMAGRLMKLAQKNTAVVGTFHILPYSWLATFGSRLLGLWNSRSAQRFDAVMAVSKPAQQFAAKYFGLQAQVVPNCFDHRLYRNVMPVTKTKNIVYLGRLVERKGALQLLKAVQHLYQSGRWPDEWHVTIGGKGQLLTKLENFCDAYGLDDVITISGFVAEADKPAFLAEADIAVFPSVSGESFGISLLEALAAARGVVLGGDNPGYRSVMEGFEEQLFDPRDTEAFADMIETWMKTPSKRKIISAKQRTYVKRFDVGVVGQKVETVYQNALQKIRTS